MGIDRAKRSPSQWRQSIMRVNSRGSWILLASLLPACGGDVDVADLERDQLRANENDSNGGADGGASGTYVHRDPADLDPACYDPAHLPQWDVGGPENNFLTPLPDTGCEYRFSGDEDRCEGIWTCCGEEYRVQFERDLTKRTTSMVSSLPDGSGSAGSVDASQQNPPLPLESCPLMGEASRELSAAAALAAEQFRGYTPAWEEAVRQANGGTAEPGELDPVPLDCKLWMADYGCHARLTCAAHEYEVRTGLEGELHCLRDGEEVRPFKERSPVLACDLDTASVIPADQCFGPGWSQYFELASLEP